MSTALWRPEINAMTMPPSYRISHVARNVIGYNEISEQIARENPLYSASLVKTIAVLIFNKIQENLINGNRVTLENSLSFSLGFTGKLPSPDDQFPANQAVQVRIFPSRTFVDVIRQNIQLERLPMTEKIPVINATEDTCMNLPDVLNPEGVLKVTGSNLQFDQTQDDLGCVIEGTRSGKIVQKRYGMVSNIALLMVPQVPEQQDTWNNEYTIQISTRYTEYGSMRIGNYRRRLRTPLTVLPGVPTGCLTDNASSPYATITECAIMQDETVRLEAIYNIHESYLSLRLLDVQEGGRAGIPVKVVSNGIIILHGFADSSLTSLTLSINKYNQLVKMIRTAYSARVVDVLKITFGS